MADTTQVLVQQLTGKKNLEECALADIQSLLAKYPYFAPAHFLLLQKLKAEGSEQYVEALNKAILYYHNPLAFQLLIDADRFQTAWPEPAPAPASMEEETAVAEVPITTDTPETDTVETAIAEEVLEASESDAPATPPELADPDQLATLPLSTDEVEMDAATETLLEKTEEEESNSTEEEAAPPLQEASPRLQLQTDNAPATGLTFEPYHAVDYFASQGIKLSVDDTGKDKFGKQLRSFTDWLKTMKRLPAAQLAANIDASSEHKVQHMAQHSIHQSEVYTETMAEVWHKQGNLQKAEEIYQKLSLIYPLKKAYFAAKIDNLKRN